MRKAKLINVFFLIVVSFVFSFCFFGCSNECQHHFNQGEEIEQATFTNNGKIRYTCIKCGIITDLYTDKVDCIVSFDLDGGRADGLSELHVSYGDKIAKPSVIPTKNGYVFSNWSVSGQPFDFDNTTITDHVVLTAKWEEKVYKINYKLEEGVTHTNPDSYTINDTINLTDAVCQDGRIFKCWQKGSDTTPFSVIGQGSTGDITLTAVFETISYKITYELDGGSVVIPNATEYKRQPITLSNAIKPGFTFDGWYLNDVKVTVLENLKSDVTVYARYIPITYSINYNLENDVVNNNPTHYTPENDVVLVNPTRDGYSFKCWYNQSNQKLENNTIKKGTYGNLTLRAEWEIINYNITYELNDGEVAIDNPTSWNILSTPVALEDHETALFDALVGKTVAVNLVVFPTPTLTVFCASVTPVTATVFASPIVR